MSALRVIAELDGPIAGDVPMLDSLLICVVSRHHRLRHSGSIPHDQLDAIPLPLKRTRVHGLPIPHCSSPIFFAESDTHDHYHTAVRVEHAGLLRERDRKILNTGGGTHRSYRLPLRMRVIREVVWFVEGDRSNLRKTLRQCEYIGKKISFGYGRVARWTVDHVDADWSWFAQAHAGTVLMRPLPLAMELPDDLIGSQQWHGSPCPPYWDRTHYCDIVRPV